MPSIDPAIEQAIRTSFARQVVQADVFAISSGGEERIATLLETVFLRSSEPR